MTIKNMFKHMFRDAGIVMINNQPCFLSKVPVGPFTVVSYWPIE